MTHLVQLATDQVICECASMIIQYLLLHGGHAGIDHGVLYTPHICLCLGREFVRRYSNIELILLQIFTSSQSNAIHHTCSVTEPSSVKFWLARQNHNELISPLLLFLP